MDKPKKPAGQGSLKSYVLGFVLSIVLTIIAYIPVARHVNSSHLSYSHAFLVTFILILAVIQLFVQLYFFLHVGREAKPYWNLQFLLFAGMVLLIVVIGSLWIMNNLNYHMTPTTIDQYIQDEEAIHKH